MVRRSFGLTFHIVVDENLVCTSFPALNSNSNWKRRSEQDSCTAHRCYRIRTHIDTFEQFDRIRSHNTHNYKPRPTHTRMHQSGSTRSSTAYTDLSIKCNGEQSDANALTSASERLSAIVELIRYYGEGPSNDDTPNDIDKRLAELDQNQPCSDTTQSE